MQRFPFLLAELCPATRIILHQNLEEDGHLCPSECLRGLWVAVCWKGWDRSQNNPICLTFRSQLYLTPDKNVCRRNKVWISLLANVFLCPWYFVPEYTFFFFPPLPLTQVPYVHERVFIFQQKQWGVEKKEWTDLLHSIGGTVCFFLWKRT